MGVNAHRKCVEGLSRIQNRGYDSAGVATLDDVNLTEEFIQIDKFVSDDSRSAIEELQSIGYSDSPIAIGHTRWATHGSKTVDNAHPHISNETFAIVHNGIIENYRELREELEEQGYYFRSETDSEVIAHLLNYYYEDYGYPPAKDKSRKILVETAIDKTVARLRGTWAVAVMHYEHPDTIWCFRNGSPLVIGVSSDSVMVASEQSAFDESISKYTVVEDSAIIAVHTSGTVQYNTNTYWIDRVEEDLPDTPEPFDHWTLKEIHEQADAVERATNMGGRILNEDSVKLGGLEDYSEELINTDHLIVVGCGTSYYAGMIGVDYLKRIGGFKTVQLFDAAEFEWLDIPRTGKSIMLVLSQSGETRDIQNCLSIAGENGLRTIGVVNVVDSTIARAVDCGVYLNAGREVGVASTKSFMCQVVVLNMIAIWFSQMRGSHSLLRERYIKDLRKLHLDVKKTIALSENNVRICAERDFDNIFVIGSRRCKAIALEGALKIKEMSYVHAEGSSAHSLRHGPFALLDKNFPVVMIAPDDSTYGKSLNVYEEISARGADILVISDRNDGTKQVLKVADNTKFKDLLCVIPLQLLAYYKACNKGINPDTPRNLAKVVTVD